MKDKKRAAQQPVEVKTYMVNCPNCGATLRMHDNRNAYKCSVCDKLLQLKKDTQTAELVENK